MYEELKKRLLDRAERAESDDMPEQKPMAMEEPLSIPTLTKAVANEADLAHEVLNLAHNLFLRLTGGPPPLPEQAKHEQPPGGLSALSQQIIKIRGYNNLSKMVLEELTAFLGV